MQSIFVFVVEAISALIFGYLLFSIFFWDSIKEKMQENEAIKVKQSNLDKIAKVKVVSEDTKEIEKFITDNAQFLSDDTVSALVARIEIIRTDKVINDDTFLKRRIDDLDLAEIEEPVVVKRASRKR